MPRHPGLPGEEAGGAGASPATGGPPQGLPTHAGSAGRLEGVGGCSTWGPRARRISGTADTTASPAGASGLEAAAGRDLKGCGRDVDLHRGVGERAVWLELAVRREWLAWCAQLLRVRLASRPLGIMTGESSVS